MGKGMSRKGDGQRSHVQRAAPAISCGGHEAGLGPAGEKSRQASMDSSAEREEEPWSAKKGG